MASEAYTIGFHDGNHLVEVKLMQGLSIEDWVQVARILKDAAAKGYVHWRLNVCCLEFIDSYDIGMFLSLNVSTGKREGSLEIIVRSQSTVEKILEATRLGKIIKIVCI